MAQEQTQHDTRTLNVDKNIVANIDNGILVLDDSLSIHHYNKWLELHTGKKEKALLGKRIDDIFENINSKTLIRKIKTALRIQTPTFYTANTSKYLIPIKLNQIKNSKFEYMQQDVSIIPFDQEEGLVALIITDQTNMANANALLESHIKEIKELNKELIKERDTIDKKILYLKIDLEMKINDVSYALLELLQYEKEHLLELDFFTYQKHFMKENLYLQMKEAVQTKVATSFEEKTLATNGEELYFKSTLVPEYNSKGTHIGFIIFRENITDSKALVNTQKQALASSRSAAMGEMIAMIAHQWRQPLSLINTVIATLKVKKELNILSDEITNQSFQKIQSTVKYLSETIDDFRDYFKPNKEIHKIDINTLFEKSIFFLKLEMEVNSIEYSITSNEPIEISTYKNELLQTLINIIKNSIDAFKESDEKDKHIKVKLAKFSTHVSIEILDNAGGIKEHVLARVFEPYYSTKSKNGTGLGLYMSKTIITEHLLGSITLTSENNQTKVLIELPFNIRKKS